LAEELLKSVGLEVKKRAEQKKYECYLTSVLSFVLMAVVLLSAGTAMYAAFTQNHELDAKASYWVGFSLIAEVLIHGFTDWKNPLKRGEKFGELAILGARAARGESGVTIDELREQEHDLNGTGSGPLMKLLARLWNNQNWQPKKGTSSKGTPSKDTPD
jgi:hypothetical protein